MADSTDSIKNFQPLITLITLMFREKKALFHPCHPRVIRGQSNPKNFVNPCNPRNPLHPWSSSSRSTLQAPNRRTVDFP
ncbi:MAG: hypothetical protein NTW21_21090 [Verrucomicrobia bacterium]|nr:hypothetical protein [Verrucomicrobiota bacterium]